MTSARPPPSIDQSPTSKPRSRRSVLVYAVMSSSHWTIHRVTDKWRLACCRGATTDEKRISSRLRLREIFAVFQPFKELTRYSRRPSREQYSEVLHLRSSVSWSSAMSTMLRWLGGRDTPSRGFDKWRSQSGPWCCSRFLCPFFQFSKRAPSKAAKFGRRGVELLGAVGAARLECGEPAAGSGRAHPAVAWRWLQRSLRLSCGAV